MLYCEVWVFVKNYLFFDLNFIPICTFAIKARKNPKRMICGKATDASSVEVLEKVDKPYQMDSILIFNQLNFFVMFDYYKKVVLENYANFNGRARRAEYWYFFLFNFIISFALGFIGGMIKFEFLSTIYSLAVLVPSIAVAIRRMHDVGKSGWFCLIPIYNIILAVTEGEKGANQYGPDPKNPAADLTDHLVS